MYVKPATVLILFNSWHTPKTNYQHQQSQLDNLNLSLDVNIVMLISLQNQFLWELTHINETALKLKTCLFPFFKVG